MEINFLYMKLSSIRLLLIASLVSDSPIIVNHIMMLVTRSQDYKFIIGTHHSKFNLVCSELTYRCLSYVEIRQFLLAIHNIDVP